MAAWGLEGWGNELSPYQIYLSKMLKGLEVMLHEQELLLQDYVPMLEKLRLVSPKLK